MSFFKSISKLGSAVGNLAMTPVDALVDTVTLGGATTDGKSKLVERAKKIAENLEESYDETFED